MTHIEQVLSFVLDHNVVSARIVEVGHYGPAVRVCIESVIAGWAKGIDVELVRTMDEARTVLKRTR